MIRLLKNLTNQFVSDGQSQAEREALIDLLIWVMFVDRKIALEERAMIDSLTSDMTWESVTPVKQYVSGAIARTRNVLVSEDKQHHLLASISERLAEPKERRAALEKVREMAQADGGLSTEEAELIQVVDKHLSTLG